MTEFLELGSRQLFSEEEYKSGYRMCRVFNDRGEEITSTAMISNSDLLYFSRGEDFVPGSGEEFAIIEGRIANAPAGPTGATPVSASPSNVASGVDRRNSASASPLAAASDWFTSTISVARDKAQEIAGQAREKAHELAEQARTQAPIIKEQIKQTAAEQKEKFLASEFGQKTAEKLTQLQASAALLAQAGKERAMETFGRMSENAATLKTYASAATQLLVQVSHQAYLSVKENASGAITHARAAIAAGGERLAQQSQRAQQGLVESVSNASAAVSQVLLSEGKQGENQSAPSQPAVEGQVAAAQSAEEQGFKQYVVKVKELMKGVWSDELLPLAHRIYSRFVQQDQLAGPMDDAAAQAAAASVVVENAASVPAADELAGPPADLPVPDSQASQ